MTPTTDVHRVRFSPRLPVLGLAVACVVLAAVLAPAPATAQDEGDTTIPKVYRGKWTLTITGKAQTNGVFTMEFQPVNEDPKQVTVRVLAKSGPKQIRNDLWKELSLAAGDRYAVKKDGDQKIVVKKANKQAPHTTVMITQQNLAGVSIMIRGD